MADTVLFAIPIESTGNITCTQPAPRVYLLTFFSPPDNRIVPAFCKALLLALDVLDHRFPTGVVVTTSGISKFYSNGLDLEAAISTPGFFADVLYPLWRRLLTYPMPTIALINGHAFAGGLMTAMMHDYRLMNPHKGYLCLNELDLGVGLRPPMAGIFRQKVRPDTLRTMILESKRYNALEALKEGLVDGLGGGDEVMALITENRLTVRGESRVYGRLKAEMWKETVKMLDNDGDSEGSVQRDEGEDEKRREEQRLRVGEWESSRRSKL